MSELRNELEKNFASADLQSDVQKGVLDDSQQIDQETKQTPEQYTAPKSYTKQFQENFKSLSPEWQEYLLSREKQTEKGFSSMGNKLNVYKWAEKLFDDRAERLKNAGFENLQDYIEQLVAVDDALCQNPSEILQKLAQVYGVYHVNQQQAFNDLEAKLREKLEKAEQKWQQQRFNEAAFDVERFAGATDDAGNLKHPLYGDVRSEMQKALKSGNAKSLEEAYALAVWAKPETRDKMIEDRIKAILKEKIKASEIAKDVSLLANSKATETPRELSLREELEAQFRKEF